LEVSKAGGWHQVERYPSLLKNQQVKQAFSGYTGHGQGTDENLALIAAKFSSLLL
jgi:hypothetical protein